MNNNDFIKVMINDINNLIDYLNIYKENLFIGDYNLKVMEYVDILNYVLNNVVGGK